MIDSHNSAQFCLGFITKVDRGVVRVVDKLKFYMVESPHHIQNSALPRSHCKGGGGTEHVQDTHALLLQNMFPNANTNTKHVQLACGCDR